MGQSLGKSSILIYDHRSSEVQTALNDMITVEGDDLDACQLSVTLHPPRVIPLALCDLRLDQQNSTGEQTNAEVSNICDFPGDDEPIRWPPLEALIEFGVGGVNTKVIVDYINGVTVPVPSASYLRVSALITQSNSCGEIYGTSAAYYLAAHVGPGFAESHAQRTIFVGKVDDHDDSHVFDVPRFGKVATLAGCRDRHHRSPTLAVGWVRFWQDPKGKHCVGDFFAPSPQCHIEVPNAAQYFSVHNESGHEMKMSVIFELSL